MSLAELDKQFQGALQSVVGRPDKFKAVLALQGPNGVNSFTYDVVRVIVERTVRSFSMLSTPFPQVWIA